MALGYGMPQDSTAQGVQSVVLGWSRVGEPSRGSPGLHRSWGRLALNLLGILTPLDATVELRMEWEALGWI